MRLTWAATDPSRSRSRGGSDGWSSAAVPGCRNTWRLEVHHIDPRAEGGGHAPENLILLCWAHHHGHHHGKLRITGRAPDRLRFAHADGRAYGASPLLHAREPRPPWAVSSQRQCGEPARRRAPTWLGADDRRSAETSR